MPKCATCYEEIESLEKCRYCGKLLCDEHYPQHMAWELRHAGLAEDAGKLWRKRRELKH